ncbi:tRNA (adenine(58)-N(1))-methyltransferase non-catalytic subunit TRM6-like [Tubulanus polymorphus]|uniref:tRNA (adenine(58)-N(1))-methyltransferase non-catalytic subunit TRM6-like n=1 Tax=Tubulanus polymorphus TaxID=672921 RepID=UPI003DA51E44
MATISENDWVIVKKDDNLKVLKIRSERPVWMEKMKFVFDGAVGHSYGTKFEVGNGALVKFVQPNDTPESCLTDMEERKVADNRNLHDCDTNQKLSKEDIEAMRAEGLHGEAIIGKLIQNSETFDKKTEFSKEKYIKKKKKKFTKIITILKPTLRLLCEMHFNKNKTKICGMRIDSLGQILSHANVRAGSNVIVVESCGGLVLGAVLERLGGLGKVFDFHPGNSQTRIMDGMPISKEYIDEHVTSISLSHMQTLVSGQKLPDPTPVENDEDAVLGIDDKSEEEAANNQANSSTVNVDKKSNAPGKRKLTTEQIRLIIERKKKRIDQINEGMDDLRSNSVDSLICATKFDPTPIVMKLIKFLKPSRPFAVYSQYKEPLMECFLRLKETRKVVFLRLSETWLREYQVLPKRTHPEINMSGGGGYLLTGTTVLNND